MTSDASSSPTMRVEQLPVVTEFRPTPNGKGRLFKMAPGMRVVLDTIEDQWEANDQESFPDQVLRVSKGPALLDHLARVRRRCEEEYSSSPLWRARAAKDPNFWKRFSPGGIR